MYCKYTFIQKIKGTDIVLIVAKCIVNLDKKISKNKDNTVLIVAKCIVNLLQYLVPFLAF